MSPMTSLTKMMLQGQEPEQDDDEQTGPDADANDAMRGPDDADTGTGNATPSNNDLIQTVGLRYGPELVNLRNDVAQTQSQLQAKQLAYMGKCAEAIQGNDYDPEKASVVFGHMASQPEFAEHIGLIHEALQQNPSALKPMVDEVAEAAAKHGSSQQGNEEEPDSQDEEDSDSQAEQEPDDDDQDVGEEEQGPEDEGQDAGTAPSQGSGFKLGYNQGLNERPYAPEGTRGHELMDNSLVQGEAYNLFKDSMYGNDRREHSMWVISKDGKYSIVRWPWSAQRDKEEWKGDPPDGAVAIVHTHPTATSEQPSSSGPKSDQDLAMGKQSSKVRMPVYVLHRNGVWKVDPGTGKNIRVRDYRWVDEFKNGRDSK